MQTIHNNFVKIETILHKSFLQGEKDTYEEIGIVIGLDSKIKKLKLGDKVYFDSYLVRKYPVLGEEDKFHWLVPYDQIVMSERDVKQPIR